MYEKINHWLRAWLRAWRLLGRSEIVAICKNAVRKITAEYARCYRWGSKLTEEQSIKAKITLERRRAYEHKQDLKRLGLSEGDMKPKLKIVPEFIDIAEPELTEKERLLSAHCVGIHDEPVKLGNWDPEGFAVFKQAKNTYYFVSWHGGRDGGLTTYQEVKKWVKLNKDYHG